MKYIVTDQNGNTHYVTADFVLVERNTVMFQISIRVGNNVVATFYKPTSVVTQENQ